MCRCLAVLLCVDGLCHCLAVTLLFALVVIDTYTKSFALKFHYLILPVYVALVYHSLALPVCVSLVWHCLALII